MHKGPTVKCKKCGTVLGRVVVEEQYERTQNKAGVWTDRRNKGIHSCSIHCPICLSKLDPDAEEKVFG